MTYSVFAYSLKNNAVVEQKFFNKRIFLFFLRQNFKYNEKSIYNNKKKLYDEHIVIKRGWFYGDW